jgi:transcription initiation factor TFIIIB Brf1 subunit/transcription initiation factor TFIIB
MSTVASWGVAPLEEVVSRDDPKLAKRQGVLELHAEQENCPKCHIEMQKSWNEFNMVCPKCQATVAIGVGEAHTIGASENHNTSENAYMRFKPVGTKNRLYCNTLIKYTSESEPYRDQQILAILKQYNFINADFKVPQDVIRASVEMFIQLRSHDYIRRGGTRRGVLGACIYEQCRKHNITKTKSQIAKMMQVNEAKITFGLEELQIYHKLGVIEVSQNVDPTSDYVDSMFEIFDFDPEYKAFVNALLARMADKKIEEVSTCFTTTKVVGAVYFLSKLMGWGLTHDKIAASQDSGISRGTYLNVTNAITKNEEKLRKVFVRHGVPFPASWKPLEKKKKKREVDE